MKWDALIQAYVEHMPKLLRYEMSDDDFQAWLKMRDEVDRLRVLQEREQAQAA